MHQPVDFNWAITGLELRRRKRGEGINLIAIYKDGAEKLVRAFTNDYRAMNFALSLFRDLGTKPTLITIR